MPLSTQGNTILQKRYLLRNDKGEVVEDSDGLFYRVARAVATAENIYDPSEQKEWLYREKFYEVMKNLDFLPNSPCLANAGKPNGQLSGCFVLPVEDSMEGIFDAVKYAALIHKTGGGTGFSFNRLRAKNSLVKGTGHLASGPISFMKVFDAATGSVVQGGMRRGANMGILNVDHPDILDFIHCKDQGGIENFNISVGITDKFMEDLAYCLLNDRIPVGYYPHQPKYGAKSHCACGLWKEIAESAWRTGDPGLWFIDRVNAGKGNVVPSIGPIESPNPCGEQELPPFGVCTLGSINLGNFIMDDLNSARKEQRINWQRLQSVIFTAVRFLDDTMDINVYPLPQIRKVAMGERRIGLGIMGWADMLIQLEIPYDSEEAVRLGKKVSKFLNDTAWTASVQLGEERGSFPYFNLSIYHSLNHPIRNATRTTIAPTGTISLIADASSGIEPLFARSFTHNGLEGSLSANIFLNKYYEKWCRTSSTSEDIPEWLKVAHEIDPVWHVRHQAVWQENVDNAVSKTINLPESATVEDIQTYYQQAWDSGCKGITVFRNNCREVQVLNVVNEGGDSHREEHEVIGTRIRADSPAVSEGYDSNLGTEHIQNVSGAKEPISRDQLKDHRPGVLPSQTFKQETPFGNLYVTITESEDGGPYELFATIGKAGSDVQAMAEAIGRTVSTVLRGVWVEDGRDFLEKMVKQWERIGGSASTGFGEDRTTSIPDALSKVLRRYLDGGLSNAEMVSVGSGINIDRIGDRISSGGHLDSTRPSLICPSCKQISLVHESGCVTCHAPGCGYSRC